MSIQLSLCILWNHLTHVYKLHTKELFKKAEMEARRKEEDERQRRQEERDRQQAEKMQAELDNANLRIQQQVKIQKETRIRFESKKK